MNIRRWAFALGLALIGALSHPDSAAAQYEDLVRQAMCPKGINNALENVKALIAAGTIKMDDAARVGQEAYANCHMFAKNGDMQTQALLEWSEGLPFNIRIGTHFLMRTSQGVQGVVAISNADRFEYYLASQNEKIGGFTGIDKDYYDRVEHFIKSGSNANELFCNGLTPLFYAVGAYAPRTVAMLIKNGANVNQPIIAYELSGPIPAGNLKIEQRRDTWHLPTLVTDLSTGAQDCLADRLRSDTATPAISQSLLAFSLQPYRSNILDRNKVINTLLDAGAKAPQDVLFLFFVGRGFPDLTPEIKELFTRLIKAGASVNAKDGNGQSLLTRVMGSLSKPDMVQWLIQNGAKP